MFQRDISELAAATIESEASLDEALERVARHNGEALVRGWTTYGAYRTLLLGEFLVNRLT